ncbi:MAG TPA: 16S rRNA (cytidine(1402)-2'-O)-methyltransferase [Syntrophales bacterium]|nr:16S rRNA (cytidine(1402)-2'-O)-methyltransferase [Syntrophales bacterium]
MDIKKGTLYVVATPIGNLEDITLRAIRILNEVQLIAAEDTRRTKKLLDKYQIHTPMTSLYEHIEGKKSGLLISKMNAGADVAFVSDAGTPGVSDPGYVLINKALTNGIKIVPVPGVSAVITALSVSGLPMGNFAFFGFLPPRQGKRKQFLSSLIDEPKTLVFYESPKRLVASLRDIDSIFGSRKVVVLRELTKVFEEIIRGTASDIIDKLKGKVIKGEVTLVVAGNEGEIPAFSDDEIIARFEKMRQISDLSRRDIIEMLAQELRISRRRIYSLVVNHDG